MPRPEVAALDHIGCIRTAAADPFRRRRKPHEDGESECKPASLPEAPPPPCPRMRPMAIHPSTSFLLVSKHFTQAVPQSGSLPYVRISHVPDLNR